MLQDQTQLNINSCDKSATLKMNLTTYHMMTVSPSYQKFQS